MAKNRIRPDKLQSLHTIINICKCFSIRWRQLRVRPFICSVLLLTPPYIFRIRSDFICWAPSQELRPLEMLCAQTYICSERIHVQELWSTFWFVTPNNNHSRSLMWTLGESIYKKLTILWISPFNPRCLFSCCTRRWIWRPTRCSTTSATTISRTREVRMHLL